MAVGLVIAVHAGVPASGGGYLGVSMFFALSGFLITRKLLDEWQSTGQVHLRRFYRRRAWRIAPPLFFTIALGALASAFLPLHYPIDLARSLAAVATFTVNLAVLKWHIELSWLSHTWSLSVEEQFYLAIPLFLLALLRWKIGRMQLVALILALAVISWLDAMATFVPPLAGGVPEAYLRTDSRAGELLLGTALAVYLYGTVSCGPKRRSAKLGLISSGVLLLLGGGLLAAAPPNAETRLIMVLPFLASAVTCGLIYQCLHQSTFLVRALSSKMLVAIGHRAYSIYLLHFPVNAFTLPYEADWGRGTTLLMRLVLTTAISEICFRLVERPSTRRAARITIDEEPRRVISSGADVAAPGAECRTVQGGRPV